MKLALSLPTILQRRLSARPRPSEKPGQPPVLAGYQFQLPEERRALRKRRAYIALAVLTFFYVALFSLLPRSLAFPMFVPVIAIFLLSIWAMPVVSYAPHRIYEWLFWGFTISLIVWPRYLAISIPGLPWITVDRIFGGPLLLLLLLYASTSEPFRRVMLERLRTSRVLVWYVSLFAVSVVLSSFMTSNPFATFNRMVAYQINWTAIFFIAVWCLRTEKSLHRFVAIFVWLIVFTCVIALLEFQQGKVLWAGHIPSFLEVDDPVVQRILDGAFRLGSVYRVVATSTTPLSLAELLCLATPFVCYLFVESRSLLVKAALVVLDAAILYSIILTDSRMGYGGFVVGHALYLAYFAIKVRKGNPTSIVGMAMVAAMPLGAVLLATAILTVGRLRTAVLGGSRHQFSNDAREDQIAEGLRVIWGSPVFGFGPGQGGPKLGYTNSAGTLTIDSYYLSILLDHGFVGFFLFYGMFIIAIFRCAKIAVQGSERHHHLAAVFGIFLTIFLLTKSVLSQPTNHSFIFIALAATVTLSWLAQSKQPRELR